MSLARRIIPVVGALALTATAACHSDPTSSLDGPPILARIAQAELNRAADSLYRAGADPMRWMGYYAAARFTIGAGPVSRVVIDVDGVSEEYAAVAAQLGAAGGCSLDPRALCATALSVAPLRVLIAWRRNDPRRMVQLTTTIPDGQLTGPSSYPGEPFVGASTLTFLDGTGGYYSATTGTATLHATSVSDTPCYRPPPPGFTNPDIQTLDVGACTLAEMDAGWMATVSRPAVGPRDNTASGTHTISLPQRSLPGAVLAPATYFCLECTLGELPQYARPPLDLRSRVLIPTLDVQVGGAVTLTFTVKNPTDAPVTIDRATAQRYDFAISDLRTNVIIWRWSADKAFAQTLGGETLGPGASVTYVEQWTPTVHGSFYAAAHLVSTDQRATSVTYFTVP